MGMAAILLLSFVCIDPLDPQPLTKPGLCAILLVINLLLFAGVAFWRRQSAAASQKPLFILFGLSLLGGALGIYLLDRPVATLMLTALFALAMTAVALYINGGLSSGTVVLLLMACGVVLRVGYILYTSVGERQHDMGEFVYTNIDYGHAGYINTIFETGKLPQKDGWQYYHPPLHHILAALWLKVSTGLGVSYARAAEGIQNLTCFYSCACMVVAYRIFRETGLSAKGQVLGMSILAFHPTFLILGGSVNNDMLMILCTFLTVLFLIRWMKAGLLRDMVGLALSLGFGMLSKMSAAMLALLIGAVFIIRLMKEKREWKRLWGQYFVFAGLSIPLGMSYALRNYLRFNQPFTFVPALTRDNPQYVGNRSFWERTVLIPVRDIMTLFRPDPFQGVPADYNIPLYLCKTSLFGEYTFAASFFAKGLMGVNLLMIALSLLAMIFVIMRDIRRQSGATLYSLLMGGVWLIWVASYVQFCFSFPHDCTMDFRYIVPTLLTGAYFLARLWDTPAEQASRSTRGLRMGLTACVGLFCLAATAVYITAAN